MNDLSARLAHLDGHAGCVRGACSVLADPRRLCSNLLRAVQRPGRKAPLVPHVLYVGEQLTPYQVPPLERYATLWERGEQVRIRAVNGPHAYPSGETANSVEMEQYSEQGPVHLATRAGRETSRDGHNLWCLPDEGSWAHTKLAYAALQCALDGYAATLRAAGGYARRLTEVGGLPAHPEPLSPTVIAAADPDGGRRAWPRWDIPPCVRATVVRHTPKMVEVESAVALVAGRRFQEDHFLCPDDATWERVHHAWKIAEATARLWQRTLAELGTYAEVQADQSP